MQIAYILDTFPGVSETFIAREIDALRRAGCGVEIFALQAGEGARAIAVPSIWRNRVIRAAAKSSRPLKLWRWKSIGAMWWRDLEPSLRTGITHIHGAFAGHPAAMACGAAAASGLPWSFSGHARDLYVPEFDLGRLLRHAAFANSCTVSGAAKLESMSAGSKAKIYYIPHGLPVASYPFDLSDWSGSGAIRILSVGRLVPKKGFDILIEALRLLKESGIEFDATIIGDGPLGPALQKQIRESGLGKRVQLAGLQSHVTVMERMRLSHCFVFAGRIAPDGDRDGLPNVVLEAAATGLPLLVTSAGSSSDFVNESTGISVPTENPAALALALEAVLADWPAAKERAILARARVDAEFNVDRNIVPLLAAFRLAGTEFNPPQFPTDSVR